MMKDDFWFDGFKFDRFYIVELEIWMPVISKFGNEFKKRLWQFFIVTQRLHKDLEYSK